MNLSEHKVGHSNALLICQVGNCSVYRQLQSPYLYRIYIPPYMISLQHSLMKTRFLAGAYGDETEDGWSVLSFPARTLSLLSAFQDELPQLRMPISVVAKIAHSLSQQLQYLTRMYRRSIVGYSLEDVIVINGEIAFFLNDERIIPFEEQTEEMELFCGYAPTDFYFSPEMFCVRTIPYRISRKTALFSLACLLIHLLVGEAGFYHDYVHALEEKKNESSPTILSPAPSELDARPTVVRHLLGALAHHPIYQSKLYWLLYRCLEVSIDKREWLFV